MLAGEFDGAAHAGRPVLVVAGEDQAAVTGGVDAAGVQVAGVGVGEVVAVALGPADEVVGVADVQGQARARVRPVEGDRGGGVGLAQQAAVLVPGVVEAGAGVTVLRVEVVGLPGEVGQEQEQVRRVVVADGERDVGTVAVGGGQDGDVRADAPVRRDLQPPGQPPVVAGDRAVGGQRLGLDDAGQARAGGDLGGAVAAVVADAVDVHAELLGRVDGDVEVDGLAGGDGAGGDEALDLLVDVVGRAGVAVGGAGGGDAGGAEGAGRGPRGRVDVPGDDVSGVVEVRLAAAQPGDGALSERVRHGVRECSRLPAADPFRTHGRSPPLPCPRDLPCPCDLSCGGAGLSVAVVCRTRLPRASAVPAQHITHACCHYSL